MAKPRSIRQRLLTDQILLILLLGGGIMATTFFGARRAVETLSRTVVTRAADQAEGELRRFFDPVAGALGALRAWAEAGWSTSTTRQPPAGCCCRSPPGCPRSRAPCSPMAAAASTSWSEPATPGAAA